MLDNCNVLSLKKPSLSLLQNIVYFGSPIALTQNVKILQNSSLLHHSSRITQYISHITYDFEVGQNIKVNNNPKFAQRFQKRKEIKLGFALVLGGLQWVGQIWPPWPLT